jgi:hypothetical protein
MVDEIKKHHNRMEHAAGHPIKTQPTWDTFVEGWDVIASGATQLGWRNADFKNKLKKLVSRPSGDPNPAHPRPRPYSYPRTSPGTYGFYPTNQVAFANLLRLFAPSKRATMASPNFDVAGVEGEESNPAPRAVP